MVNSGSFNASTRFAQDVRNYLQGNFDFDGNGRLDHFEVRAASQQLKQWNNYYQNAYAIWRFHPEVQQFLGTLQNYTDVANVFDVNFNQLAGADGQAGLSNQDIYAVAGRTGSVERFSSVDLSAPVPPPPIDNTPATLPISTDSALRLFNELSQNGRLTREALLARAHDPQFGNTARALLQNWDAIARVFNDNADVTTLSSADIINLAFLVNDNDGGATITQADIDKAKANLGTGNQVAALDALSANFAQLDADRNNILDATELASAGTSAENAKIAELNRELMFASIELGNAAWHGLSASDIASLKLMLASGKDLDQAAADLRAQIAAKRGIAADQAGFRAWVDSQRQALAMNPATLLPSQGIVTRRQLFDLFGNGGGQVSLTKEGLAASLKTAEDNYRQAVAAGNQAAVQAATVKLDATRYLYNAYDGMAIKDGDTASISFNDMFQYIAGTAATDVLTWDDTPLPTL